MKSLPLLLLVLLGMLLPAGHFVVRCCCEPPQEPAQESARCGQCPQAPPPQSEPQHDCQHCGGCSSLDLDGQLALLVLELPAQASAEVALLRPAQLAVQAGWLRPVVLVTQRPPGEPAAEHGQTLLL